MKSSLNAAVLLALSFSAGGCMIAPSIFEGDDPRLTAVRGEAETLEAGQNIVFDRVAFQVPLGWGGGKFADAVVLTPDRKQPHEAGAYILIRKHEHCPGTVNEFIAGVVERDIGMLEGPTNFPGWRPVGDRYDIYHTVQGRRNGVRQYWVYTGIGCGAQAATTIIFCAYTPEASQKHFVIADKFVKDLKISAM